MNNCMATSMVSDNYKVTSTITMKAILYEFYVDEMTSAVTVITVSYEINNNPSSSNNNNNNNDSHYFGGGGKRKLINTPFQIIDHGSVLYLILMQILLYDQHTVLPYATMITTVGASSNIMFLILDKAFTKTTTTSPYASNNNQSSFNNGDSFGRTDNTKITDALLRIIYYGGVFYLTGSQLL